MFILLVSYRAIGDQKFRRLQLINTIDNFKKYFLKNKIEFKIIIGEQNNDKKFNRGLLLNAIFLESEKNFNFYKKYIHMNVDYNFDLSRKFPDELLNFKEGFLELYRLPCPVLGSACVFDPESYKTINGFPNNLEGWGGDDHAIYNRILKKKIKCMQPVGLYNSNFIIEETEKIFNLQKDYSNNDKNINLANNLSDLEINGLNSIKYKINGNGEFHDNNIVFHYLINDNI